MCGWSFVYIFKSFCIQNHLHIFNPNHIFILKSILHGSIACKHLFVLTKISMYVCTRVYPIAHWTTKSKILFLQWLFLLVPKDLRAYWAYHKLLRQVQKIMYLRLHELLKSLVESCAKDILQHVGWQYFWSLSSIEAFMTL